MPPSGPDGVAAERGSHSGDGLRFVDLDLAAARHVEVRVDAGQVEGGVEVVSLEDGVSRDVAVLGEVPSVVTRIPPARGVPKSVRRSPSLPAQAFHGQDAQKA